MNLIRDKWIPIRRKNGEKDIIAPWEIGMCDNPVVEIETPRPDFRGALYQFMIGLLQTSFAPKDDDEWKERWEEIPENEIIHNAFKITEEAFEFNNDSKICFLQDTTIPKDSEKIPICSLLIDAPSENRDLFVKMNTVNHLCKPCSAQALFTLQINSPEGGRGHYTGMRGGGPMTTLVKLQNPQSLLWNKLWINVLANDEIIFNNKNSATDIFPWLTSIPASEVFPKDVSPLHMFWAMPRRIKILSNNEYAKCDICGKESIINKEFIRAPNGWKYSSTWLHVLSPYRSKKEPDGMINMLSIKGKQGGFAYPDWFGLTITESAAKVIKSYFEKKIYKIRNNESTVLWCFGYHMVKMNAKCWYEHSLPLIIIKPEVKEQFINCVGKMINAARESSKLLRQQVIAAWFIETANAKGDFSFIEATLWENTEQEFYDLVNKIKLVLENKETLSAIYKEWVQILKDCIENLFDRFALNSPEEITDMKRVTKAAENLGVYFNKNEAIRELKALAKEDE